MLKTHFIYQDTSSLFLHSRGWLDKESGFRKSIEYAISEVLNQLYVNKKTDFYIKIIADPSIKRTAGGSFYLGDSIGKKNRKKIFETSLQTKLKGKISSSFEKYKSDAYILINPEKAERDLHIESNPNELYIVPKDKKDFISMIKHEMMHVLGVAGYYKINGNNRGENSTDRMTIFDSKIHFIDSIPYFKSKNIEIPLFCSDDEFLSYSNMYHIDSKIKKSIINPEVVRGEKLNLCKIDFDILEELNYKIKNRS